MKYLTKERKVVIDVDTAEYELAKPDGRESLKQLYSLADIEVEEIKALIASLK